MTPEEWQRVRPVLESALELDSAKRSAFLDGACANPSLRLEVESLIAVHEQAGTGVLNSTYTCTGAGCADISGAAALALSGGTGTSTSGNYNAGTCNLKACRP